MPVVAYTVRSLRINADEGERDNLRLMMGFVECGRVVEFCEGDSSWLGPLARRSQWQATTCTL